VNTYLLEDQKPNVDVEGYQHLIFARLLLSFSHWACRALSLLNLGLHDVLVLLEQCAVLWGENEVCCGRVEGEDECDVIERGPREIVPDAAEQCCG
jgi:hypothetical protein